MKADIIKQFVDLRRSLETERAKLQARLKDIETALQVVEAPLPPSPGGPKKSTKPVAQAKLTSGASRTMSAAGKRAVSRAAKARWAAYRAEKAGKLVARKAPSRPKGELSAAGRAAIVAGQKARWAKAKAAKEAKSAAQLSKPPAKGKGPGKP